ncbi:MAG TPA: hypothetical protein VD908_02810 [Cytophagales bacterium]|nr:hypothetical protein [Cytophagales bacterium]
MKKYTIFSIAVFFIVSTIQFSCTRDPYEDVYSNERSIDNVTLGGDLMQVGPAVVDREKGTATVKVLMQQGTDLSNVVAKVLPSYRATISPGPDQPVNFAGNNNKFTYTVTAESGSTRDWTVELVPFTETLLGTYDIQGLIVFGGTGPEYGGGAVMPLTDKPWVWPETGGPAAEMDNQLTFEYTGTTALGETYGKVTNSAGADGLYANFLFIGDPQTDVNPFYRTIPKGEATWTRNYEKNTVTFTFSDGRTAVGTFEEAGTEDLNNGLSKTITDNAFSFTLKGTDDWDKIYSDYDKFVKNPRKFWIDIKRR